MFYALPLADIVISNRNENFKEEINEKYVDQDDHIALIFKGRIIDTKIFNPFSLYKSCLKKSISQDNGSKWVSSASLIFSLRTNNVD